MKVAVVGKGGVGKTTLAGTLARTMARRNQRILAIDGDPNPNLALTLGMPRDDADRIRYIPSTLSEVIKGEGGAPNSLRLTMEREQVLCNYAVQAPDGVKLIVMGKPPDGSAGQGCMCASHRAVRALIAEMTIAGDHTLTDMEAGLEHLKRGTARNVEVMLVVTEPYYRSLEAASRTFALAKELAIPHVLTVANKVRGDEDQAAIEQYCARYNMPIIGMVPYEEGFVAAEMANTAPFDHAPGSAGLQAVEAIVDKLMLLKLPPNQTASQSDEPKRAADASH